MQNLEYSTKRSIHPEQSEALIDRLTNIGIQLSAEKNVNALIRLILEECVNIVGCDAGSIYIKESVNGRPMLKFSHVLNKTTEFPYESTYLPMDRKSITGFCADTGAPFIFNQISDIKEEIGLDYNNHFDLLIGYTTMNMMVIPMLDINNEVLGVLQLINKKADPEAILYDMDDYMAQIVPFEFEESRWVMSLASQAGILIERAKLLAIQEKLFVDFVESMVITIDKRDPTTSGHSMRVAKYVKTFAEEVNRRSLGSKNWQSFTDNQLKEIYYASLLHDIGKIGVSENLLCKRHKLSDAKMETIQFRFHFLEKELALKKVQGHISQEEIMIHEKLPEYLAQIIEINAAPYITDADEALLLELGSFSFVDPLGNQTSLLKKSELNNLMVKRGNLNPEERQKMMNHAAHTYEILNNIPWPKELRRIPQIAAAHHEKLDGSGYPYQLKDREILFESKLIAIADIYEALTAEDRPYRKSMSTKQAIGILKSEAESGYLDKDLVNLFTDIVTTPDQPQEVPL